MPAPIQQQQQQQNDSKSLIWAERRQSKGKLAPATWPSLQLADARPACKPVVHTQFGLCFVAAYDSVRIISFHDGSILSTLSVPWDKVLSASSGYHNTDRRITGLLLNPQNPFQLITAHHRPGLICNWDFLKPALLKIIVMSSPIQQIIANQAHPDHLFVTVVKPPKQQHDAAAPNSIFTSSDSLLYKISLDNQVSSKSSTNSSDLSIITGPPKSLIRVSKTKSSISLILPSSSSSSFNNNSNNLPTVASYIYLLTRSKLHMYPLDSIPATAEINEQHQDKEQIRSQWLNKSLTIRSPSNTKLTCLAINPVRNIIATGDEKGYIRFWHNIDPLSLLAKKKSPSSDDAIDLPASNSRTTRWHSSAVGDVCFTANGSYLLSGGQEGVLVLHHLESGHLDFIPRLGFSIVKISAETDVWSIGLADGTTVFIDSQTLKPIHSVAGIKTNPPPIKPKSKKQHLQSTELNALPLAIDPVNNHVVLPSSHPSSIQFYSPANGTHLTEVQVSPANSNRVTQTADKPVQPVTVDNVAFSSPSSSSTSTTSTTSSSSSISSSSSKQSSWMATVDSWSDTGFSPECRLKFWQRSSPDSEFQLETSIDTPHQDNCRISSISFSTSTLDNSSSPLLMTTGEKDDSIKLWYHKTSWNSSKTKQFSTWDLYASFSWRQKIPRYATFSPDGSIIAVAYNNNNVVTLWDTESQSLLRVMNVQSDIVGKLEKLLFVNVKPPSLHALSSPSTSSQPIPPCGATLCLIASGSGGIVAWNVRNAQELFTFPVRANNLFTHSSQQDPSLWSGENDSSAFTSTNGGGYFAITEFRGFHRMPSNFIFIFRINPFNLSKPDIEIGELPYSIRQIGWWNSNESNMSLIIITKLGDVLLTSPSNSNLQKSVESNSVDLSDLSRAESSAHIQKKKQQLETNNNNADDDDDDTSLFSLYSLSRQGDNVSIPGVTNVIEKNKANLEKATSRLNEPNASSWITDQNQRQSLPSVFNVPSYLMPPLSLVCNELLIKPITTEAKEQESKQQELQQKINNDSDWLKLTPPELAPLYRKANHDIKQQQQEQEHRGDSKKFDIEMDNNEKVDDDDADDDNLHKDNLSTLDQEELTKMFENLFKNQQASTIETINSTSTPSRKQQNSKPTPKSTPTASVQQQQSPQPQRRRSIGGSSRKKQKSSE